jgi:hypothetical protein
MSQPRSDIGPVEQYLQDAYNLRPEVVRVEQLEFRIRVVDGVTTFQTPSQRIDPEFIFVMRRIKGYAGFAIDPQGTPPFCIGAVFNIEDQGRARGGVFRNPIRMSILCDRNGSPAHDMVFDSFYVFVPGADVAVNWQLDPAIFTGEDAPPFIEFGVSITGDVLRTRTLPGGALVTDDLGRRR